MGIRISERTRSVVVIVALSASVLVATAALAKLALPDFGADDRPDPELGRPVTGVSGPVLVPIIDVSPVEVTPVPRVSRPPPSEPDESSDAKAKKAKKAKRAKENGKSNGGAGSGGNGPGEENKADHPGGGSGSAAGKPGKGAEKR